MSGLFCFSPQICLLPHVYTCELDFFSFYFLLDFTLLISYFSFLLKCSLFFDFLWSPFSKVSHAKNTMLISLLAHILCSSPCSPSLCFLKEEPILFTFSLFIISSYLVKISLTSCVCLNRNCLVVKPNFFSVATLLLTPK